MSLDLAHILEQSGDGILALDSHGVLIYANKNAASLLGYVTSENLLGLRAETIFSPHDSERILAWSQKANGEAFSFETFVGPPSGRWLGCRCLTDGRSGVVLLFRDINERKLAEAARQEADKARRAAERERERMSALLNDAQEAAQVGCWELDLRSECRTWTGAAFRLLDFPVEEGEPGTDALYARYHPDDLPRLTRLLARTRVTGDTFACDVRVRHRDNSEHWLYMRGRGEKDATDRVVRLYGTMTDITERKHAEERLSRSEARLQSLITNFQCALLVEDEHRRVVLANEMFCQLFDLPVPPESLYGRSGEEIADACAALTSDPVPFVARMLETLEQRSIVTGEEVTLAGNRRVERDFVPLHPENEAYRGHLWLYRDVTERHEREAHLRATADELRRSNAALEEFAYIASHDLKEPLRKIQTFGGLLERKAGHLLPLDAQGYLDRMTASTDRMQALIDGLLLYSRAARQPTARQSVDLAEVIRAVLVDLEARLAETGGVVEAGPLPEVLSDPLPMRQLFQNLLGNALKFRREGVQPLVRVWATSDPQMPGLIYIHIADNGIGFPPDQTERIFGLFERLEGRASGREGNGVGLAICRKIAERHGGTLTATAVPNKGATFTVCLPVA